MASNPLSLLLFFALVVTGSAGVLNPNSDGHHRAFGPIETNGKFYTKVCDPDRFTDLGLNIADFKYCNKSLPYDVRVNDLVSRMSLAEKVLQLGDRAQGASRIGLQKYTWWGEALHGI